MNEKYKELYKELVEAYYNSHFEETFVNILDEFKDKDEAKDVLTALCGVDLKQYDDDFKFTQALIDAMAHKQVTDKIIQKVQNCTEDCEQIDGKSKCQSVCPFDAIIRKDGGKWIDENLCMSCGRCVTVCDKGTYLDTQQFLPVANELKDNDDVYAIVAPAIAGQFGKDVTLDQLREAFLKIGFKDMLEVAMAADVLSVKEALEFDAHVDNTKDFMISSCCCPVWVGVLRKYYHDLIPDISPSVSPMIAMARIIKKLDPDAKVVFIGPCIAKKAEAKDKDFIGDVDFVLTFQELQLIFDALEINPAILKGVPSIDYAATGGRLYAHTGGVSQAVFDIVDQLSPEKRKLFTSLKVDGMKDCKELLQKLQAGEITKASFIEGMGCDGGCVGGPKAIISKEEGTKAVDDFAHESAIKIPVHSKVLLEILKKLGFDNYEELVDEHSMFERRF